MSNGDGASGITIFGERVRFFRKRWSWSQEYLANEAGLSQPEISKIEKGLSKEPNEQTIRKIAKGLKIDPEDLVRATPFASIFGQIEILPTGNVNQGQPILAYFASALTGLQDDAWLEIELLDQRVDEICRRYPRYPLVLYRPRTKTSPKDNPIVPAPEVYNIDLEQVAASDLLILAAVFPSLGAGMELQLALQSCSSVLLLRKEGQALSRMVVGCPVRMEIVEYSDLNHLDDQIPAALDKLVPSISEYRFSVPFEHTESDGSGLGSRIKHIRERRGLKSEDLARMVGVGVRYIEAIEIKPEEVINPSLKILRRISRALNVADTFLMTGHESPIQHYNSIFSAHKQSLDAYATEIKMPVDDYMELWKRHVDRYAQEFSVPGIDRRIEVGNRKYWVEKYDALKKERDTGTFASKLF